MSLQERILENIFHIEPSQRRASWGKMGMNKHSAVSGCSKSELAHGAAHRGTGDHRGVGGSSVFHGASEQLAEVVLGRKPAGQDLGVLRRGG